MKGTFIVISGPSGSGKGTLIEHAREKYPSIVFARSLVSRARRPGEEHSATYLFTTAEDFKQKIEAGEFLEWAIYSGNYYGTLKSEVLPYIEEGKTVLKEIETQGARQVIAAMPREQVKLVFIDSGSWQDMETRIKARAPISDDELAKRKRHYEEEMLFMPTADYVVKNEEGRFEETSRQFDQIIMSVLHSEHAA